jgi:hypothetical protein
MRLVTLVLGVSVAAVAAPTPRTVAPKATPAAPRQYLPPPAVALTPAKPMVRPTPAPRTLMTGEIIMTGMRMQPRTVDAQEIIMTGVRMQPRTIETEDLSMTGMRSSEPER